MTWKGVIIGESLDDKEILKLVKIVSTRKSFLEAEKKKGRMKLHSIEVSDERKAEFVTKAELAVKQGWYLHIVKDDSIVIVFRKKHFEFSKKEKDKMKMAEDYGISIGILPGQMEIMPLFENPFG